MGSDPSVLRPFSHRPPVWPDLSVAPSPRAQGAGPWARQWWAEWGRRWTGSDQSTDLNGADGSGGQRLQVLRMQEVAGVRAQHLQDPDGEPVCLAQGVRRGQERHRRRHRRPLPASAATAAAAFGCPWVRSSGRIAHLEEAAPLGGRGGRGSTGEASSRGGWARSAAPSAVQQPLRLHPSSTDATAAAAAAAAAAIPGEQHKNLRLPRAARQIAAIGSHTSKGSPRPPNRSSRRDPGAGRAAGGGRRRRWAGRALKGPRLRAPLPPRALPLSALLPSPQLGHPYPGVPESRGLLRDPKVCALSFASFPIALFSLPSHRGELVLAGAVTLRPCVFGVGWTGVGVG